MKPLTAGNHAMTFEDRQADISMGDVSKAISIDEWCSDKKIQSLTVSLFHQPSSV